MVNSKVISSMFLIAGCAMGAGCLALPLLAAGAGFAYSSVFIIIIAIFSYMLARYSLESFILYKKGANISTVVSNNFGKIGLIYNTVINVALMYAVLTVYMAGGADLIRTVVLPYLNIHISGTFAICLFMLLGYLVFIKGSSLVVRSNTIVFTIKLVSFTLALLIGLKYFNFAIFDSSYSQSKYLLQGLPVFFAALGFHMAIPVVAELNDYDRKKCNKIIAYSIIIMVVLYILWIGVTFSLIARTGSESFFQLISEHKSVGDMINMATHNNPHLPSVMIVSLNTFSSVALLTSFLSIGVSLYEYWRDHLKIEQNFVGRNWNFVVTMLPPFLFAIFYPNGFVFILQQATIILILTIMTPVVATLKNIDKISGYKPSKAGMYVVLSICVLLVILQLLDNFGYVPIFGVN